MTLSYNDSLSPDQNLEYLADSLEQQIRNISTLPSRAAEVEALTLRARAAREGHFLHDPRSISVTETRWYRSGVAAPCRRGTNCVP